MASGTSKQQPLLYPLPNKPMVPTAPTAPAGNPMHPVRRHIGHPLGRRAALIVVLPSNYSPKQRGPRGISLIVCWSTANDSRFRLPLPEYSGTFAHEAIA